MIEKNGWAPIETASKTGYCLGFDPALKVPHIIVYNVPVGKFIVSGGGGFGDETFTHWHPLPALPNQKIVSDGVRPYPE